MLKSGYETVIIKCDCLPEMRKDRVYKITMRINDKSGEIQFAKCGCVAGKGPRASCKHIASVCYSLKNFSGVFLDEPEHLACTDLLQKWNQPRKRRLSPKKINELDFAIESHNKKKKTRGLTRSQIGLFLDISTTQYSTLSIYTYKKITYRIYRTCTSCRTIEHINGRACK